MAAMSSEGGVIPRITSFTAEKGMSGLSDDVLLEVNTEECWIELAWLRSGVIIIGSDAEVGGGLGDMISIV